MVELADVDIKVKNTAYIGFVASKALVHLEQRYVDNIRSQADESQSALLADLLGHVVDDALEAFFMRPMAFVGISDSAQKIVNSGANSIKKAVQIVVQQVACKLSNDDMRLFAEYMHDLLHQPSERNGQRFMVAFPITAELRDTMVETFAQGRDGDPQHVNQALQDILIRINHAGTVTFFERPVELLKLNFVLKKIAQTASEAIKKANRWVVKSTFKGMTDQQLLSTIDYIESVLIEGPEHQG